MVKLEELKDCLTEEGYTIFGHGTGGNNIEAVDSIFSNGLRASHASLFYTTENLFIGENLEQLTNKLNHWDHMDSENIILIKLPNKYFNTLGDSLDLDCEKTGAFVNEKIDENGKKVYYLDPKFIIGAYNRNISGVNLNPNFEKVLSKSSIREMNDKLLKTIKKTKEKFKRLEEQLLPPMSQEINENQDQFLEEQLSSYDINSSLDDLNWDDEFPPLEQEQHKKR